MQNNVAENQVQNDCINLNAISQQLLENVVVLSVFNERKEGA